MNFQIDRESSDSSEKVFLNLMNRVSDDGN